MANRTVPAERLQEGSIILIRGKLAFSRLARFVDGQALVDSIARQRAQGRMYPTTSPYTTVNLLDPQVMAVVPNALTPEETFINESIYTSKSGDNAGHLGYSIDSTGTSLPQVLVRNEDGTYAQVALDNDLATGLDVTLVLNVFKPRAYEKRGIGLSQVLVNEPLRYYSGGVTETTLAARGIIVQGGLQTVTPSQDAPVAEEAGVPAGSVIENGLAMPGPAQAAPVAAPVPVAQAAPVVATVPGGAETAEQKIARMEAEMAALRAAQGASGGDSAFGAAAPAVPVAAAAAAASPWDQPGGIQYEA